MVYKSKTTVYNKRLVNCERSDISRQNQDRHDQRYVLANYHIRTYFKAERANRVVLIHTISLFM